MQSWGNRYSEHTQAILIKMAQERMYVLAQLTEVAQVEEKEKVMELP